MNILARFQSDRRGASAVEFAIVSPLLIMLLLTFIGFGIYLNAASSVQQIAADAARTAVAGLNANERSTLANDYIQQSTINYFMIDKRKLSVNVQDDPNNPNQFTVSIDYDAQNLPIWSLYGFALPDHHIRRFSTIRLGGL
jgi:Flp pilus assembly protein TadG